MQRFLLLTASLLALAAPAFAQNDPATDETVVVTATRSQSALRNAPADVDVIDVEEARARGDLSIVDVLESVPGLAVVRSGPFGQQTSIFSGGVNSNHTLVLFDGIRVNDPSTPGSSFDAGQDLLAGLARIEVVQGPLSALYGSDAIGGAINMIPRHGGEGALNARLDMAAGSFDTLTASASVDGTLGRFRYAITGEGYATEGHDIVPERMPTHTGDPDGAESMTVTGVFDLALSDALSLDLLIRHREARADFDAFPFDFLLGEYRADDPDLEISRNDLTIARLGATWRMTDALSLRATTARTRQIREQTNDGVTDLTYEGERESHEASLEWRPAITGVMTDAAVTLGAIAETENADTYEFFGFPPATTVDAEQDHQGAFLTGQGTWGALTLTGAVRVDDYEGFGTETTWRAGASYELIEGVRVYAAYGTSYRAPTLYERFVSFGNPNLQAEEGETWEAGADARVALFGRADGLTMRALYRSTDLENLIDFNGSFEYDNVDLAEIESAEARAALRPTDWLTLEAAYTWTDARDAVADTQLLRRPEHQWTAAIVVDQGPFTGRLAWRHVGERADQMYGDDSFFDGVGVSESYDIARASASWRFNEAAQIFVTADNLFDEDYEPSNAFAGAPRSVMAGIRLTP
ncbi:MAG: TonB-dependent receptor [Hyphomonadaceae bacterium]